MHTAPGVVLLLQALVGLSDLASPQRVAQHEERGRRLQLEETLQQREQQLLRLTEQLHALTEGVCTCLRDQGRGNRAVFEGTVSSSFFTLQRGVGFPLPAVG